MWIERKYIAGESKTSCASLIFLIREGIAGNKLGQSRCSGHARDESKRKQQERDIVSLGKRTHATLAFRYLARPILYLHLVFISLL